MSHKVQNMPVVQIKKDLRITGIPINVKTPCNTNVGSNPKFKQIWSKVGPPEGEAAGAEP